MAEEPPDGDRLDDDRPDDEQEHLVMNSHQHGDGIMVVARDAVVNLPRPHDGPQGEPAGTGLPEAADTLAGAIGRRWRAEDERRRFQGPKPLSVSWKPVDERQVEVDHQELIWEKQAPKDLSRQLEGIVEFYRLLPNGRLVVLGKGGSGKTVLGVQFILLWLENRPDGTPVPEIFGLGSWNLVEESLHAWLSHQLARDQPWLTTVTADGKTTLAEALVREHLVLPVLDGFDEIPEGLRDRARQQLSETSLPYVLTSRREEYGAAVSGTRGLHRAAVVELVDVTVAKAVSYLRLCSPRGADAAWDKVRKEMEDNPDGPLAQALSTPLMVDLAAIVHGERGARGADETGEKPYGPEELLKIGRQGTREMVEDALLSAFVDFAYRDESPGHRARIREWHGYLARQLGASHDLKWWELGSTLSRPARLLAVGSVTGLAFGLVDTLVAGSVAAFAGQGLVHGFVFGLLSGVAFGLLSGLAFALAHVLTEGGAAREPSDVHLRFFGGTRRSRRTYLSRLLVGGVGGFGFGAVTWFVASLTEEFRSGSAPMPNVLRGLLSAVVGGLLFGLLLGVAYAGGGSGSPDERPRFKEGMRQFRQRLGPRLLTGYAGGFSVGFAAWLVLFLLDLLAMGAEFEGGPWSLLMSALRIGLAYGPLVGLASGLAFGLATALADPIHVDSVVGPTHLLRTNRTAVLQQLLLNGLVFGLVGLLFYGFAGRYPEWLLYSLVGGFGTGIAFGLSLTAWGHWVILSRVWLPLTGRLPWALAAFLEDAHRRGVLRQSGAVFQFRHARLKEHLARAYEEE
ncbi:hypothetical protein [Streptomyces sp. NPDC058457]|uniref:hypothetical protein n=1 Tax=Streptomyces sp. NPDC058457 TaxID=3346507 RepID=UPI00365218D5